MSSDARLKDLGMNVLVRSPNWLGDAVMTLPAIWGLLENLPYQARLSVLTPEKLYDFWYHIPRIDRVLIADENPVVTGSQLKNFGFTSAIIFPNSPRTALECLFANIRKRYGFHGRLRKWIMTKSWSKDLPTQGLRHHSMDYVRLIEHLGGVVSEYDAKPPLYLPENPMPRADILAICPGAEYGQTKRWSVEGFAKVADHFISAYGLKAVLLGAERDEEVALQVKKVMENAESTLNLAGQTRLTEFTAWIAHARFVLCNDSGAMHLAAGFQTPGVAIFGSTEPRLTGPIHESIRVIREHVPCSPCFLRECPIDFRCMERVTAERVIEEADAHYHSYKRRRESNKLDDLDL